MISGRNDSLAGYFRRVEWHSFETIPYGLGSQKATPTPGENRIRNYYKRLDLQVYTSSGSDENVLARCQSNGIFDSNDFTSNSSVWYANSISEI
jgi:hypothetical protein